jgi:preprotein translocase subunit SecD
MNPKRQFILIICITIITAIISLPKNFPIKFNLFGLNIDTTISSPEINFGIGQSKFYRDLTIQQGLDLQGGVQLVLKADMEKIASDDKEQALESTREIINRRVDLYGVTEPNILTSKVKDEYRIVVELPGIQNVDQSIELIGKTAQLDFREIPEELKEASPEAIPVYAYVSTGLGGKDLKKASVQFGSGNVASEPVVSLQFTSEGAKKFAEVTKRNLEKPVAIFLDEIPVTAPIVRDEITSGEAVISGNFTTDSAKELVIQLNAGALPVPIEIIEQRTIGPSLGQESIQKSVTAGLIGLGIVMLFMIGLYGRLGIIANAALIIYGLITLSIYKLVPITLSLPGVAGFIISVGMAVDANILIFERMKEEMRSGQPRRRAMELGFGRAWDSIKDANLATILTALILLNPFNFNWLVTSGMVRGFALTLLIGVLVGLFTGIVVSRNLIRVFYKGKEEK